MVLRICFFLLSFISPPLVILCFEERLGLRLSSLIVFLIGAYCFFSISTLYGVAIYFFIVLCALYNVIFKYKSGKFKHLLKDKYFSIVAIVALFTVIIFMLFFYKVINVEKNKDSGAYIRGEQLFSSCMACHRQSSVKFVGPHLIGIYEREAGSVEDYEYSTGLREANFTWTDDKLRSFLINQNAVVPGTRMIISPLDEREINDIIKYIKTL
jgi:cytochrome c